MTTDRLLAIVRGRRLAASGVGRGVREAARLSQADIGDALGVARQAVWQWEDGRRILNGEHAIAYAELIEALAAEAGVSHLLDPEPVAEAG